MLYLNCNNRQALAFDTVAPFFGKEVSSSTDFTRIAMALEEIEANIRQLKGLISDRPVNYMANDVDLEDLWAKVSALVNEVDGKNVQLSGGGFPAPTPSAKDTGPAMKPPSRKPSKKKA